MGGAEARPRGQTIYEVWEGVARLVDKVTSSNMSDLKD